MRRRTVARWAGLLILATGVAFIGYCGHAVLSGNFNVVSVGELYRSAQPTPQQLEAYHRLHGIRTVINLRGASDADWYRQEVDTAHKLGMVHIDFRMSAKRRFSIDQADALLAVLKAAPKPILIHCTSGADRSGLVAVLYLAGVSGAGEIAAERQLSILYGHIGIPFLSRAYAMDESWELMEPWLGFAGS